MTDYKLTNLPIQFAEDHIHVDESFLAITKSNTFLTKHLRKYYLSTSSVYQKIVYKSYFIEEKFPGPLTRKNLKLKVTTLFPDVVGIEFAKTKTVYSKEHPRLMEILKGAGLLLLQKDTASLLDDAVTYVFDISEGNKVVIPPNWHYTLVNTGKETLATVELYEGSQSLHHCHCDQKGTGVYIIERNGVPEIVKNSQYKNLVKYATVDPENYATRFKIVPTQSLAGQVDTVFDYCTTCSLDSWEQYLNDANKGFFPF
ncbi:MAG: glucose-6-phosphate isomerase family protein [Candidatus Dojkabacteria bacterium]|nr:MAG: glucose-6-phosphate isomerase family protein [Candidatus Dojkabacteria bacterium]